MPLAVVSAGERMPGAGREHRQPAGDRGDRHHVGALLHPQSDALARDVAQVPDDRRRGGEESARQARARAEFEQAQSERDAVVRALEIALRRQLGDES